MIYHPKVMFVENPRTASSYIADLLLKDGGERLTPRHGSLPEPSVKVPSFVVVRNPYQRVSSAWKYIDEVDSKFPTLGEWITSSNHPFSYESQLEMTTNVDHVLQFEKLSTQLPALFEEIGLGHIQVSFSKKSTHRVAKADKEEVAKVFKKDFTELGYKV